MKQYEFIDVKVAGMARRFPDRVAVREELESVSYLQLERRANGVACLMRDRAGGSRNVMIILDRSASLIAAVLGLMKCGLIFVPVDPRLPTNRIRRMIKEVEAEWVITSAKYYERIAAIGEEEGMELKIALIDDIEGQAAFGEENVRPFEKYNEKDCYIYFTSGSTGTPKGVLGRSLSLAHFIEWEIGTFGIDQHCRVSQLTSPGFDPFLRDVFVPLSVGGTCCIPRDDTLADPTDLIQWIDQNGITLIHIVPSLFKIVMDAVDGCRHFPNLKYILLAGEMLRGHDIRKFIDIFKERVRLVNLYGPTETTLVKLFYLIKAEDVHRPVIPVGQPMEGAQVMVMDSEKRKCRPGKGGEIYIRTPFRSSGYYNNPTLTGELFIPNPYGKDPRDLIYRTGDLGRLLADGNVELYGRTDQQVKIGGARVELGEIENQLLRHPDVKEAVVEARKNEAADQGDHYLCAYFLSERDLSGRISGLREFLAKELPAYMIPSHFMQLEQMPLTANGKIDRQALPVPDINAAEDYAAPRDETEDRLAAIWADVLNLKRDQISIDADFFKLGGHSLKVNLMVVRIQKTYGVEMDFTTVFKKPTIRELAGFIRGAAGKRYVPLEPHTPKQSYSLSSAQRSLFVLHQWAEDDIIYNIPNAVILEGEIDRDRLADTFRRLIRRHESLRTTFHIEDDGPVQRVEDEVAFAIEYDDLKAIEFTRQAPAAGEHTASWQKKIRDFIRPFDLSQAPLFRVGLIRLEEKKHLLIIDVHHIIFDALSHSILIRDFISLYREEELPNLRLQYKDYAEWQNSPAYRRLIRQQEAFWLKEFDSEPPLLDLPLDYRRGESQSFAGDAHGFVVDRLKIEALKKIAIGEKGTLNMVMLTVLYILLARLSGQEDIVVGMPAAGRRQVDVENIIGVFINTLALRNHPGGGKSFRQFLREVIGRCLLAYENQDYPFDTLVRKVWKYQDSARNPLFDVFFEIRNADIQQSLDIRGQIPGLKISPYQLPFETTKIDMDWIGMETEEGVRLRIIYCTELFEPGTIRTLAEKYLILVDRLIENPDCKIKDLNI